MDGGVPMFEPGMPAIALFVISIRLSNRKIQSVAGSIAAGTPTLQLFAVAIAPETPIPSKFTDG